MLAISGKAINSFTTEVKTTRYDFKRGTQLHWVAVVDEYRDGATYISLGDMKPPYNHIANGNAASRREAMAWLETKLPA